MRLYIGIKELPEHINTAGIKTPDDQYKRQEYREHTAADNSIEQATHIHTVPWKV